MRLHTPQIDYLKVYLTSIKNVLIILLHIKYRIQNILAKNIYLTEFFMIDPETYNWSQFEIVYALKWK